MSPPQDAPHTKVRSDYQCVQCSYGVVANGPPFVCPMCSGVDWERISWRPFSHGADPVPSLWQPAGDNGSIAGLPVADTESESALRL